MTSRFAAVCLGLCLLVLSASASAQVHAELRPDSVGAPYRYVLELVSDGEPADVVFDRRLLSLRVHAEGRRRALRCRHPGAPTRTLSSRVTHLDSTNSRVAEWLDLRMYCTGSALEALRQGARVEARYGFRRRGRRRWVVKSAGSRPLHQLELSDFSLPPVSTPEPAEAPIRLSFVPTTVHVGTAPTLGVKLRSDGPQRVVYPRDDLYRFHIRGPLGEVECVPRRAEINPIVDLYRRVSGRRAISSRVSTTRACPEAFSVEGVYEVTPEVDLVYGGERYDLDAVTGHFEGPAGVLRVVGRGYLVHPLGDATP